MSRIICFGSGGHATVLLDTLFEMALSSPLEIAGILAFPSSAQSVLGVKVLGDDKDIRFAINKTGADSFVVGIGMVSGGDSLRERTFAYGQLNGLRPFTVVHPSAIVSRHAEVALGACIMAGAVVQARVRIGENTIVNTGASIDHDCVIGAHCHIAPGAILSGGVTLGRTVHVGVGAIVRNGIQIGDRATIGAGAVLVSDCPAEATMIGIPAREMAVKSRGQVEAN